MDIREYSSGGKHNCFGITKHGNRYLRTAFVEANQRGYRTTRISDKLKARRKDTSPELIDIANRCLKRLNKKGVNVTGVNIQKIYAFIIVKQVLFLYYGAVFTLEFNRVIIL